MFLHLGTSNYLNQLLPMFSKAEMAKGYFCSCEKERRQRLFSSSFPRTSTSRFDKLLHFIITPDRTITLTSLYHSISSTIAITHDFGTKTLLNNPRPKQPIMSPHALSVADQLKEAQPQHSTVLLGVYDEFSTTGMLQEEVKVLESNRAENGDEFDEKKDSTHTFQVNKEPWTQEELDTLKTAYFGAFRIFVAKEFPGKTLASCLKQALRLFSTTITEPSGESTSAPNLDEVTKSLTKESSLEIIVRGVGLFRLLPQGKRWTNKVTGSKTKTKRGRNPQKELRTRCTADESRTTQDQTVSNGAILQNTSCKIGTFLPRNTPQGYMYGQNLYPREPSHPAHFSAERLWAMYSLLHIQVSSNKAASGV